MREREKRRQSSQSPEQPGKNDAAILLAVLLFSGMAGAADISSTYWSYACTAYIYQFDVANSEYKIYSKLSVTDKTRGSYDSYQLTEGNIARDHGALYVLSGKDMQGKTTIDFTNPNRAILKSDKFGRVALSPCDRDRAQKLIGEAERHLKVCPKDVLNCKSR